MQRRYKEKQQKINTKGQANSIPATNRQQQRCRECAEGMGGIGYFLTATLQNEVNIAFKVRAIFSLIARQKAFYR